MKKIAIIGAGELGQQIAVHIQQDTNHIVGGFFDDFQKKNSKILGLPILGEIKDINHYYQENFFDEILIGIGYRHLSLRKKIYTNLNGIIPFATFVHSTCFIDKTSKIKEGSIIYPGCIIDQRVTIHENTLINLGCTIAHDSSIGPHSFLSPSTSIAGFVELGENVNIGINTTIIDSLKICDEVKTGGGTVLINDINKKGLYVGNPARFIK
jgi:sugar O-acyltransferase (sialic acid O-acetyltransferase NeuD family)